MYNEIAYQRLPTLPATGYLRISQIVGDPNAHPPIPPIIPIGRSTWWAGVKSGRFPAPVKLGPRITVWKVQDVLALIDAPKHDSGNSLLEVEGE